MMASALPVVLAAACVLQSAALAPQDDDAPLRVEVALQDGTVDAAELLAGLLDSFGVPVPRGLAGRDWPVPVTSTLQRLQLEVLENATSGALEVNVGQERLVVEVDRKRLEALGERLLPLIDSWLVDLRNDEAQERGFGVTFVTDASPRAAVADLECVPPRVVVLVHGLDDPGWLWRDMIPALRGGGHDVARFEYPNDGPVAEAADLLAVEMAELREAGVERVDLVVHSMGGLVSRDLLTRPAYYGGDGRGGDRYPAVDRLIMIGTPNGGSHWARLRGFSELGEHLSRAIRGERAWIDGEADGRGEAGEDLLPGSVFLRRLNDRPLPARTRCTIIAGRASPLGADDVDDALETLRESPMLDRAPGWLRDLVSGGEADLGASALAAAIGGIGDGVVALDSARLEGVDDFVVVQADHLGLIVNVLPGDDPPPSIAEVLERLGQVDAD